MKNMKIKLKVIHFISGRARIKVESGFDPKVFFYVLEAGLREVREIKKADLNPYSQSITVYFGKDVDIDVILKALMRILTDISNDPDFSKRMEDIQDALAYGHKANMDVVVRDKILRVSENLDQAVRHMSGNAVDMRTAVPVSSVATGIAALILAPGWATPAWLVLLTFGITSFHLLKHDHRQTTAPVNPSLPEPGRAVPVKRIEESPSGLPETG